MTRWEIPLARGRRLQWRGCLVMGILNATPDSFSDGGAILSPVAMHEQIRTMIGQGAQILDVGGESTRPGHTVVPADEELRRVIPVIKAIRALDATIPISIDTRKSEVAQGALAAGADLVNDVSGGSDPAMLGLLAREGCAIVLMRHRALDGPTQDACRAQWDELVRRARASGVRDGQIILDPGLGFGDPPGSDPETNLALAQMTPGGADARPYPVLVAGSRKRFIGTLTGITDPARRVGGSVALALLAAQAGAAMVRVHDVDATMQALTVSGRVGRPGAQAAD